MLVYQLTGFPKRLIVEAGLADLEFVPFLILDIFVDVDDMELLVLDEMIAMLVSHITVSVGNYVH